MRVVAISDTHGKHDQLKLPEGDVLIHAGDLTTFGTLPGLRDVNEWLGTLKFKTKIIIAGNHDFCLQNLRIKAEQEITNAFYLRDQLIDIDGYTFYGAPWQPKFGGFAFNLKRGNELAEKWRMIPDNIDVLITHGPPFGYGDITREGIRIGCEDLRDAIQSRNIRYHVFGHIHESYGVINPYSTECVYINACSCNRDYLIKNNPIVFDL